MTPNHWTLHPIAAAVMALSIATPVASAVPQGAVLSFAPGANRLPVTTVERTEFKAGQRFQTGPGEVRELLFPDGTSVTLAPNTEVLLEALGGPPPAGGLVLRVNQGLVRIVGGTGNDAAPNVVLTAAERINLNAASAVIGVGADGSTRANLLVGGTLAMSRGSADQSVNRPGFGLLATPDQKAPTGPARQDESAYVGDIALLGTRQLAGQGSDDPADSAVLLAAASGTQNGDGRFTDSSENRPPPPQIGGFSDLSGGTNGSGAGDRFAAGDGRDPNLATTLPTQANNDRRSLVQDRDNAERVFDTTENAFIATESARQRSPTTSRLYSSEQAFSQSVSTDDTENPRGLTQSDNTTIPKALGYVFFNDFDTDNNYNQAGLILNGQDNFSSRSHVYWNDSGYSSEFSSLIINNLTDYWPSNSGDVERASLNSSNCGAGSNCPTGLGSGRQRQGHMFVGGGATGDSTNAQIAILQAGFSFVQADGSPLTGGAVVGAVAVRADDNFLLIEVRPATDTPNSSTIDPTRSERFLFATGNVDRRLENTWRASSAIDRFFISAGLENFEQKANRTVASGIRAFMRNETALGLNAPELNDNGIRTFFDSGVFVVNPASTDASALLHADFGMSGAGPAQKSTISATIGLVRYLPVPPDGVLPASYNVETSARTVGSSSDARTNTTNTGTAAITSPWASTSAGGGNPALARDGYAGYLVLENYVPEESGQAVLTGGTEQTIGGASQSYAALRLATGTGQVTPVSRTSQTLTGWAGGLAERAGSGSNPNLVVPVGTAEPGNLSIQTNSDTNRVQATVDLSGYDRVTLGGLGASTTQPSAFVDDKRFAAGNTAAALVSADVLRRNPSDPLPTALQSIGEPYAHLQWGFFFGDIPVAGSSDHLHMGTWVAGREFLRVDLPRAGQATYTGHAIGNVTDGAAPYTAVGTYRNTWDFARGSGTANLAFDGATYTGTTRLKTTGTGAGFDGALAGNGRTGGVIGSFYGPRAGSANAPAAVGGRFVIQQGTAYRASGTFGAEQSPPRPPIP